MISILKSAVFIYTELLVPSSKPSTIKSAAWEKLLFFSTPAKNTGSDTRAMSTKLEAKCTCAWMGIPNYHSDCSSRRPCLSFLECLGTARLQRTVGSAKMEQLTLPSTLPFSWILSARERADRFPPALVIWESTAGKPGVSSSTLLDRLLKVFHIL